MAYGGQATEVNLVLCVLGRVPVARFNIEVDDVARRLEPIAFLSARLIEQCSNPQARWDWKP